MSERELKAAEPIQALHIVACSINERKTRGTPEHASALALKEEVVRLWKDQLWSKEKCPHCGKSLRELDAAQSERGGS